MIMQTKQMIQQKRKIIVSCENLKFGYSSKQPILNGISLNLYQGESTVLFGKSGSGKTTLLRCISGYSKLDSGKLIVNNLLETEDLRVLPSANENSQYAHKIAQFWKQMQTQKRTKWSWWDYLFRGTRSLNGYMVFADGSNALPQLTVEENLYLVLATICYDPELRRKTTKLLLKLTGLTEVSQHKPSALSSGQLRRLCLAQGLGINPGLLILDEPTNGLDFSTKGSFLAFLEFLRQTVGITVLSVTHDLEAALFLADRLLLFRDGQIVKEIFVDKPHPRKLQDIDTQEYTSLRRILTDFLQ
ncbi:ATP-binding cassette domain-containing protein (plasmid) [Nostoc sp. C057]|nr:ATP-binding cassette domain-containing protein [Nostoc sp. C057]